MACSVKNLPPTPRIGHLTRCAAKQHVTRGGGSKFARWRKFLTEQAIRNQPQRTSTLDFLEPRLETPGKLSTNRLLTKSSHCQPQVPVVAQKAYLSVRALFVYDKRVPLVIQR